MDPPSQATSLTPTGNGTSSGLRTRRRSSIAYDPARDTFTEIPETLPEESSENASDDLNHQTKSASNIFQHTNYTMTSSPRPRKRSRSISPSHDSFNRNGETAVESPQKRPKSAEERDTQTNGSSAAASDARIPAMARGPRIPKITRRDGEGAGRPPRPPSGVDRRRPDNHQDNRRRPDDERPRDYEKARERPRRRSRSPGARVPPAYRRRSPPRNNQRDPDPSRSPSPIRDSPPREFHRPGGARGKGRNLLAEQERLERQKQQPGPVVNRSVQGVTNQWYNSVPEYVKERGRDWRRNESQIRGLRSFNNWVKSCIIQKFSPQDKRVEQEEDLGWGETAKEPEEIKPLLVLDIGCGKGGDLGKWDKAPQPVGLYVGLDPADLSVKQASDRFKDMWKGRRPRFDGQFETKDCFGEWIGEIPIVRDVGIDPTPNTMNRWGKGGGFDIVTMMFSMHYSFESQEKVEMMLRNVSGALKKGGRFIGVCPNSDVLSDRVKDWFQKNGDQYRLPPGEGNNSAGGGGDSNEPGAGTTTPSAPSWGNSIYSVRFPPRSAHLPALSPDGSFRPPFAHKYTYFIAEAVDVPEFVVPWEAFRAIAENYGLEQRYRKGFLDIWHCETDPARATNTGAGATGANGANSGGGWGQESASGGDDGKDSTAAVARELEQLGVKMGVVRYPGGPLCMTEEEKEAVSFYHAFCFVKS